MRSVLLLLLVSVHFSALAGTAPLEVIEAQGERPQGVFLVVHGLNLKPSKMLSLASSLSLMGYSVFNVGLSGHLGGPLSEFKAVKRKTWVDELCRAYVEAQSLADQYHVPIYFLGYSLGGAIGLDALLTCHLRFDKMVLFSPALTPRNRVLLVRALRFFPKLRIPSKTPKEYRANNGTPVRAYNALFDSLRTVRGSANFGSFNVDVLVFLDPKDELVSLKKLEKFISLRELDRWKVVLLSNDQSTLQKPYHHIIIDEEALGSEPWLELLQTLEEFLLTP
jgi:esterase/lipase